MRCTHAGVESSADVRELEIRRRSRGAAEAATWIFRGAAPARGLSAGSRSVEARCAVLSARPERAGVSRRYSEDSGSSLDPHEPVTTWPAQLTERYDVGGVIGRGASSEVFEAADRTTGDERAVAR